MEALWLTVVQRARNEYSAGDTVLLLLLLHSVYLIPVYFALKLKDFKPNRTLVLAAAFLFRATLLPMGPVLSDDMFRYQWEGRIQTQGLNPYAVRPIDIGDASAPGRDFRAVYGPLTEMMQRAAYSVSGGHLLAMKAPAVIADAALLALLAWKEPARLLIYAWSPIPVLEFWGQGHNDALPALFVAAALLLPEAGVWLGLAASVKWWPLVLVPSLARRGRDWLLAGFVPAVLTVPYIGGITVENMQFASGFLGGWRNNDSLYGFLLWLTGGDLYLAKYIAFAILGVVSMGVLWLPWTREKKALLVVVSMLLVSANVHPWYLAWIAPLLIWYPLPWLFLWAALMSLAYESAIWWKIAGVWTQSGEIQWMIYLPVAAVAVWNWWSKVLTGHSGSVE